MEKLITCNHCGVKFEEHQKICPICDYAQATGEQVIHDAVEERIIHWGWKNMLINVAFFILLVPSLLCIIIDYMQNDTLVWSPSVILPIFFAWLYLLLLIKLILRPVLLGTLIFFVTIVFLYLLNYLQQTNWFVSFGLPLVIGIPFISIGIFFLIRKNKHNFLKIIALLLLGMALISIYIELIYSFNLYSKIILSWSLVVLGSSTPIILFLFYLSQHKKILEKWVHL